MPHTRVFQFGNSQAVHLPKEFRFQADSVEIFHHGDEVVVREISANATAIFDVLASMPADFVRDGCEDSPLQKREGEL